MLNRDELKTTSQAIDKIHLLCVQETKKGSQLLAEVGVLFQCIRCGLFLSLSALIADLQCYILFLDIGILSLY